MTFQRLSTVFFLLPIGIFVIYSRFFNGAPFFLVALISAVIIANEIYALFEKQGFSFNLWLHTIALTLSYISFYLYSLGTYDIGYLFIMQIGIISIYIIIIMGIESISGRFENSMENITLPVFSYVLLGIFTPLIAVLKVMDLSGWLLTILLIITFSTDTGGWLFGKLFGRHKVRGLSSPNKTMEGFAGAILMGLLGGAGIYIAEMLFPLPVKFSLMEMVILTVCVIIAGIAGDLGESTLKRWANLKDSGDLLPGHGGFFDRFDSLLFAAPVFYFLVKLMGH
jgi:phosphatidate cytidylyltransferase